MIIDLSNKVVVVTGSSRGIGSEIVRAFAREKTRVVINYYKSEAKGVAICEDIMGTDAECMLIKCDVKDQVSVKVMFEKIIKKFGRIDILINNAGICMDSSVLSMSYEQWRDVIDVNLTGTFLCSQEAAYYMKAQKCGKIINIASIKGQEGNEYQTNYCASKAGVIGFTKSLAKELGKYNIQVNAVCPGFISTDLNRENDSKMRVAKNKSILSIDHSLSDLISFLIYISSDNVNGVTGRVFNIDSRL